MKQALWLFSSLIILSGCQASEAGSSARSVVAPNNLSKESDAFLSDEPDSEACGLVIPNDIKKTVPSDMQYFVFLQVICNLIRSEYVHNISEGRMTEKMIAGLLESLDLHSSYLNEQAFTCLKNQTDGEFGGIGIEMMMDEGVVRVISPIDDTPAYKAGIKSGDLIIYVNDECVNGLTTEEVLSKLRGKPKTQVRLKIKRGDNPPFDTVVTRDIIKVQSVKTDTYDNIGYIRISTFDKNTSRDVKKFVVANHKLDGIVIDVRNNPGGLLDEAVAVSNIFLQGKKIVSTRGRTKDNTKEFFADNEDPSAGIPLVVLINSGTASAPEIMAGALRDNKRAVIVGVRSFGKGSVQKVIPLSEKTAIRLTVAKHYTPSGECIQANGISPDIEADVAVIKKPEGQFVIREEFFNNALDVKKCAKHKKETDAQNKKSLDAMSKKRSGDKSAEEEDHEIAYRTLPLNERVGLDYQLNKAFDTIKVIAKFKSMSSDQHASK